LPHFVFIYPQIKRLTGAQRLILALAGAVAESTAHPCTVTLLTHRFAPECRPALSPRVNLLETGRNLNLTGNHYLDSLLEYLAVPGLLRYLPPEATTLCFFGPPSLPGLWWAKKVRRLKQKLLYFCYEPPRAAYTDRLEVTRRMGWLGRVARPFLWLYRPVDRYLTRQASAVLVNGQYGQQLIRETYGLPAAIITHGAETNLEPEELGQVAALRRRYGLGDQPVLLTVNHLHPRKRVNLLLETMPLVLAEHPDAAALIVGNGPEKAGLQDLAARLGLNPAQVIFAGFVPETELAAHYAAASLYVHTGRAESFGLAVLEACMAARPVVAVAEGGPREILQDGQTGFLVEPAPAELASKINYLLAHPDCAQRMGRAGAAWVSSRYTWQKGAEDFFEASRE
jgi:glycosyltransferase involved in cell wall biosynthesis